MISGNDLSRSIGMVNFPPPLEVPQLKAIRCADRHQQIETYQWKDGQKGQISGPLQ